MAKFFCEVYLERLEENIKRIRGLTPKKIMAVVKGDAYGLGIERISEFLDDKVDSFAVAYFEEAIRIKSKKDILIMTPEFQPEHLEALKENYILTLDDYENLCKLTVTNWPKRVHLFINTGMNRFGLNPMELKEFISTVKQFKQIKLEGIYTHLHNTKSKRYTQRQIFMFNTLIKPYKNELSSIHILNSRGILDYKDYPEEDNTIRVGRLLFGYEGIKQGFQTVFQFKATPLRVYEVKKGEYIGYGNRYKAKKNVRVGILPFGYNEKFYYSEDVVTLNPLGILTRLFYKTKYKRSIAIHGRPLKILGSANMNYTLVDMQTFSLDSIINVTIDSIAADSSVRKVYLKEEVKMGSNNLPQENFDDQ